MTRAEVAEARGQHECRLAAGIGAAAPCRCPAASRLLKLRQQIACLRVGQPVEGRACGRRSANVPRQPPTKRATARRDLLADLRGALEGGLRVDLGASNDAMVRGWLELAQIAVAPVGQSPLTAASEVARWRSRFPLAGRDHCR